LRGAGGGEGGGGGRGGGGGPVPGPPAAPRGRDALRRLPGGQGVLVPLAPGGRRRLGAGGRRLRVPRPAVLVGGAAGPALGADGGRRGRGGAAQGRPLG